VPRREGGEMPAITIQSLELTQGQKEILAETFISKFSELTRVPKDRIYVFFDGYTLDNAATNGVLFSRRPPQAILGKFNESEHARLTEQKED
jgi:phenylpyruvate tautomerase PptA (4-oxalocrotonate tautomerase family)